MGNVVYPPTKILICHPKIPNIPHFSQNKFNLSSSSSTFPNRLAFDTASRPVLLNCCDYIGSFLKGK